MAATVDQPAQPAPTPRPTPADARVATQARVGLAAAVVLLAACFALLVTGGRASATPETPDVSDDSRPSLQASTGESRAADARRPN